MSPLRAVAHLLVPVLLPSMAFASEADVSPALRARAEAVCRDDDFRLCADAISDETAILACIRPTRAMLAAPCRKVFDEVVQDVRR